MTAIWTFIAALLDLRLLRANAVGRGRGTAPSVVAVIALVCAGLFVVAVVCYIADGAALKRRPPAVVAQATAVIKHRPVHHHPYLHTAVGAVGFVFLCLGMALFLFVAVIAVPGVVNGVAYLTGTGGTATFVPQSYAEACGSIRVGCTPDTDGVLEYHGTSVSSTWPDVAPLGQPFHVRDTAAMDLGPRGCPHRQRRDRDRRHLHQPAAGGGRDPHLVPDFPDGAHLAAAPTAGGGVTCRRAGRWARLACT